MAPAMGSRYIPSPFLFIGKVQNYYVLSLLNLSYLLFLFRQHYSVLGGDVEGARQVNVLPTPGRDVPADVYTAVARRVDAALAKVRIGGGG